jgi:hypothetical protein
MTRVSPCAWRCRVRAAVFHFLVDIVDGGFGADEALKVGFHEDLEGCRLLIDRFGKNIEAAY